jgi:hypothetical protein
VAATSPRSRRRCPASWSATARLTLAGPPEAGCALKGLLPAQAVKLVAAEGSIPMYASGNELAARLRSLDRIEGPKGLEGEDRMALGR